VSLSETVVPMGRYRRKLEGADFSLEANTRETPEPGHFYLLQKGHVVLQSDDFKEAVEAYRTKCREFWERKIESANQAERIASAWGLIELDPNNKEAAEVINTDGDNAARQRLMQIRKRHHYAKIQAARQRKKKEPAS
jgi:hypothetical protein